MTTTECLRLVNNHSSRQTPLPSSAVAERLFSTAGQNSLQPLV